MQDPTNEFEPFGNPFSDVCHHLRHFYLQHLTNISAVDSYAWLLPILSLWPHKAFTSICIVQPSFSCFWPDSHLTRLHTFSYLLPPLFSFPMFKPPLLLVAQSLYVQYFLNSSYYGNSWGITLPLPKITLQAIVAWTWIRLSLSRYPITKTHLPSFSSHV